MKNQSVALDLKVSRRKAGLLQADLAHLLGVDKRRICDLEKGRTLPTVDEITALSLIYGKPLESLLAGLLDEAIDRLAARLQTLPRAADAQEEPGFNRAQMLADLARRLEIVAAGA